MHSKILREMLFFNISSSLIPTFGGRKHWLLDMEDSTNYAWSNFLNEKSDLKNVIMSLIGNLKTKDNIQVWHLNSDNAGEKDDFKGACIHEGMGMEFEYTTPGTLQQNGQVHWKYATLFNWVHVMLKGGKFSSFLHNDLLVNTTNTATLLKNNLISPKSDLSLF